MHYTRLPKGSRLIGAGVELANISQILHLALRGQATHYYACEPIEEAPVGGSLFYTSTAFAAMEFHFSKPLSSTEVAQKLIDSIDALQYPPNPEHRVRWKKGWEIRTAMGPRGFIVIALPTWVEP